MAAGEWVRTIVSYVLFTHALCRLSYPAISEG